MMSARRADCVGLVNRLDLEATMLAQRDDVEMIQRQMREIRRKHHEQVRDVLAGAERVASLERKFQGYSWVAIAAGVAAVCWVAMSRGRNGAMKTAVPSRVDLVGTDADQAGVVAAETLPSRPGWAAEVTNFLTTLAIRAAQSYAIYCVEDWIAARRVMGPRDPVVDTAKSDPPRSHGRTRNSENQTTDCGDDTDKKCGGKVLVHA